MQLLDLKRDLAELKSGSVNHKKELDRFIDENEERLEDPYTKLMLPFLTDVHADLSRLSDQVQLTERTYVEALRYFGEGPDPKRRGFPAQQPMRTEDFFGIFREFCTAYRKVKSDNVRIGEQRAVEAKRRAVSNAAVRFEDELELTRCFSLCRLRKSARRSGWKLLRAKKQAWTTVPYSRLCWAVCAVAESRQSRSAKRASAAKQEDQPLMARLPVRRRSMATRPTWRRLCWRACRAVRRRLRRALVVDPSDEEIEEAHPKRLVPEIAIAWPIRQLVE